MSTKFQAEINSAVATIREWQRGAINWAEAMRRADLTRERAAHLKKWLSRYANEASVRRLLLCDLAA